MHHLALWYLLYALVHALHHILWVAILQTFWIHYLTCTFQPILRPLYENMRWQKCSHTKYAEVLSSRKCYIFPLHSSPNKFVNSTHSLSLLGLAYEGWKENFCPGLQFTFVGLDLCRSAMLRALWPWLLLLPTFTKLWLKHQLFSFPSDESCKLRTGLVKLTRK